MVSANSIHRNADACSVPTRLHHSNPLSVNDTETLLLRVRPTLRYSDHHFWSFLRIFDSLVKLSIKTNKKETRRFVIPAFLGGKARDLIGSLFHLKFVRFLELFPSFPCFWRIRVKKDAEILPEPWPEDRKKQWSYAVPFFFGWDDEKRLRRSRKKLQRSKIKSGNVPSSVFRSRKERKSGGRLWSSSGVCGFVWLCKILWSWMRESGDRWVFAGVVCLCCWRRERRNAFCWSRFKAVIRLEECGDAVVFDEMIGRKWRLWERSVSFFWVSKMFRDEKDEEVLRCLMLPAHKKYALLCPLELELLNVSE